MSTNHSYTARSTYGLKLINLTPLHTGGQNFLLTLAERCGKIKIMSALVVAGLCVTWWETCWQIKATRQTVRQRVLVPRCGGSSPSWPVSRRKTEVYYGRERGVGAD